MKIKNLSDINQILIMIGFVLLGTLGRYILVGEGVQPFPNFEIIMVITFLAAMILKPTIAFLVPLLSMVFSDLLIGNPILVGSQMNKIVLFTYSGFAMIAIINIFNRNRLSNRLSEFRLKNTALIAGLGIGFVLLYDIWTNIGWWYLMYPHNATSLSLVFTAGIPFMIYHLISGIVTFIAIGLPVLVFISRKVSFEQPIRIKKTSRIPIAVITICLIALSFTGTATQVPEKSEIWLEQSDATSVKILLKGNGWTIQENLVASTDDTVFTLLQKTATRHDISLQYTYYEEFDSVLIDEINNDENGEDNHYWQYYVNDEIPMIGADSYHVSNGDYIEWRFEVITY